MDYPIVPLIVGVLVCLFIAQLATAWVSGKFVDSISSPIGEFCQCGHEKPFHDRFIGRCYFFKDVNGTPHGCKCFKFRASLTTVVGG